MQKTNPTTFNWPLREGSWDFNLPWHCLGNWFFYRWTFVNTNKTNLTIGTRILGFTKIDRVWLIPEEQAKLEHEKGVKNLFNWLMSEVKEAKNE